MEKNEKTDMELIVAMILKGNDEFEKRQSTGYSWVVFNKSRGISFHFKKDGSFEFMCTSKV